MITKNLYIIAGCNGAGKTTASYGILPTILDCKEFINADEIAKGLPPFGSSIKQTEKAYLHQYNLGKKEEDWLATKALKYATRDTQSTG